MTVPSKSDVLKELTALQLTFKQQLPHKLAEINHLWKMITEKEENGTDLTEMYRIIHSLAGSGGTFGAMAISTSARELEKLLKLILNTQDQSVSISNEIQEEVDDLLTQLTQVSENWQPSAIPYIKPLEEKELNTGNLIYLAEDDELLAKDIISNLIHHEYDVRHFADLDAFEKAIKKNIPAVIIMDIVFKESEIAGAEVINKLQAKDIACPPVIFISLRDDIEVRLAVARAGASRYFSKPLDMKKLTQTLDGLTARTTSAPFRILIIDDDENLLQYYVTVLRNAGMEVEGLSDPLKALQKLNDFKPDITVLDVYMNECSGPELAQVIRQDDNWAMMPIMFLSTEVNLNHQLAAMNLGGDDFLVKPVDAEYLVSAVSVRAKRARWTSRLNQELKNSLRESEYQTVTMSQHNIVSYTDVAGRITHVNDKFCKISGYSSKELIGQNHRILKSNHHSDSFYKNMWETISSGQIWHDTICNVKKNGEEYWVDSTIVPFLDDKGKSHRYVAARTDVTLIRQSEERLAFAVEGAGDGVWDWDMSNNDMQFSRIYMSMLGYTQYELPHHADTWIKSVHSDDFARVQKNLQGYLEGQTSDYIVDLRLRCKDDSYKWILCRGTVVSRDSEGKPLRMIGIHSDITKQKENEEELVSAREDAEKANRAKSQFLSSMSHELRTPMNAIMGFGQLLSLEVEKPLSTNQKENVDEIMKASDHLLDLINEVLDLSQIEAGRIVLSIEDVLLGNVISESLKLISPLADKRGISIKLYRENTEIHTIDLVNDQNIIRADYTRTKQIIINLLSNAVKYNSENGKISITCSKPDNHSIRISITDTGKGLTQEQQTQLFTPFNRLGAENTEIEGTGIGLVITRNIIELMGGYVGVESELGVGSTFWFELPSGLGESDNDQNDIMLDSKLNLEEARTVLYIEDNPANLRLVTQLLGRLPNLHMWTAHEPMLGLELAVENRPDLILLDINLPGIDGFEVLKLLKQRDETRDTPVIAISANAMSRDIEKGLEAGFDDYITKPINLNGLLKSVDERLKK